MMASKVFISYRRDDSAGHAGRVHDRLEREFGRDLLFMDVDAVPLGVNFVKVLSEEVAKCDVLLAVIGPNWLNARDEEGNRRLDNPHDFVRVEIGAALQRNIPVIPILLDGAKVPKPSQLPKELEELSLRNGLDVRHVSFHNDIDKLVRSLQGQLAEAAARRRDEDERRRQEAEIKQRADEEERRRKAEAEKRRRDEEERRRQEKLQVEARQRAEEEEARQRAEEERRREGAETKLRLAEAEAEKRRQDDRHRRQAEAPAGETKKVALFQINFAKGNALKFAIPIALLAVVGASIALYSLNQVSRENTREPLSVEQSAPANLSAEQSAPANLSAEQSAPANTPLEEAATQGGASAMYRLGLLYQTGGQGVTKDYAKAREWYEKAAAKGDASAMTNVGLLYHSGLGVTQDYTKAREWYEKAADKGNASAMFYLGCLYQYGEGVTEDYAKAREWYEKAAAKGDASAKFNLRTLPRAGRRPVPTGTP
jgi:TPR repeat protein